jgi:pimeloyl-ACP methyl ester carboxylesterase
MRVVHGRVVLEVTALSAPPSPAAVEVPPLLLLHGLFGSSDYWAEARVEWPAVVYGLDFSGHGRSQRVKGGAYTPELLAGDADAALEEIGRAALAGAGVGAYVALLVAGARPDLVPAAVLLPGLGLEGGGPAPRFEGPLPTLETSAVGEPEGGRHDPLVRQLSWDVRPPDYARAFAAGASCLLFTEDGTPRPPWWEAARGVERARVVTASLAFEELRRAAEGADSSRLPTPAADG